MTVEVRGKLIFDTLIAGTLAVAHKYSKGAPKGLRAYDSMVHVNNKRTMHLDYICNII